MPVNLPRQFRYIIPAPLKKQNKAHGLIFHLHQGHCNVVPIFDIDSALLLHQAGMHTVGLSVHSALFLLRQKNELPCPVSLDLPADLLALRGVLHNIAFFFQLIPQTV